MIDRQARFYGDETRDQRNPFQRDRDRVLYTSAFRRLTGITQVVHAGEGHVFHNRLTHTLEVGQIAQRLAEYLLVQQRDECEELGVDSDVVQAAAWAHDLGHPPFGHIAEEELDELLRGPDGQGFEGNAQSFRIVTRLAVRRADAAGLDLTAATLNAILKYPTVRPRPTTAHQKFGAYDSERAFFDFARELGPAIGRKSAEAEIMDWADDIAYAVHDLEDFYRAGLIPLDRLLDDRGLELDRFLTDVYDHWPSAPPPGEQRERLEADFRALVDLLKREPLTEPYEGRVEQRAALREVTSMLIARYVTGPKPKDDEAEPPDHPFRLSMANADGSVATRLHRAENELALLKRLTWTYVILNPKLASQQLGQRRIVRELYEQFRDSAEGNGALLSPASRVRLAEELKETETEGRAAICGRIAADTICRMTEDEALKTFNRLTGTTPGSVLEPLIR